MDFEEFVEEDDGPSEGGWWKYRSVHDGADLSEEKKQLKDAEFAKYKEDGQV